MPTSPAIQKQINQVNLWLESGLTREEIIAQNGKKWQLPQRTLDTRIKQAKLLIQPAIEKAQEKVNTKIQSRAESVQERLAEAHLKSQELLAGAIEDILGLQEDLQKKNEPLANLTAIKTAFKSGVTLKDLMPLLRIERGLPNNITKTEGKLEITPINWQEISDDNK